MHLVEKVVDIHHQGILEIAALEADLVVVRGFGRHQHGLGSTVQVDDLRNARLHAMLPGQIPGEIGVELVGEADVAGRQIAVVRLRHRRAIQPAVHRRQPNGLGRGHFLALGGGELAV